MNFLKKYSIYLFLLLTVVTLLLTLLPADKIATSNLFDYDKFGHFALFFGWTLSFGLTAFFKQWNRFTHLTVVLIASLVFGLAIEVLQRWAPLGRSFEWADWAADGLGSLTAILILFLLRKNEIVQSNSTVIAEKN
jgi:VanZ family protein